MRHAKVHSRRRYATLLKAAMAGRMKRIFNFLF